MLLTPLCVTAGRAFYGHGSYYILYNSLIFPARINLQVQSIKNCFYILLFCGVRGKQVTESNVYVTVNYVLFSEH